VNDDAFLREHRILAGRYRLDRRVAAGGFGVVFAAHHLVLDVPIAIKVLHERFA
jgi:serine/threonine protein kinase